MKEFRVFDVNEVIGRTSQEVGLLKETEERDRLMSIAREKAVSSKEKSFFSQNKAILCRRFGRRWWLKWMARIVC